LIRASKVALEASNKVLQKVPSWVTPFYMTIQQTLTTSPKAVPPFDKLGFGQHFSDHWFVSKFTEGKGWYESFIEPLKPFAIHPAASVLHYAQTLFEGMKAFRQADGGVALFRPQFNYDRFASSAERLCMACPPQELFLQAVRELVKTESRWVPTEDNTSLYIRPTLIGTEPFLGVRPSRDVMFFVLCSPVGSYYAEGSKPVKIWVEEKYVRAAPGGLGSVKAGANYAASLKAAAEARAKGYAQVLWLDVHHEGIEEVGTMNVFFVFKNEIVTPALNGTILPGGVRDSTLQLLRHQGIKVTERKITMNEVFEKLQSGELLEAFGTGTAAVISPIGQIHFRDKDWTINKNENGPVSTKLRNDIVGIQRGTAADPFGWMEKI
jgi:branched-chain amino acid aminotransferase